MTDHNHAPHDIVEVFSNADALAEGAAERFLRLAREAVTSRDVFTVALSGGSTPRSLYALMATDLRFRSVVPWQKIHFFFGDERYVPLHSAESNYHMADEAMFRRLPLSEIQVHPIRTERSDAADAALEYQEELAEFFHHRQLMEAGFPRLDLVFLGMGEDGHTASLFPRSSILHEKERWVVASWVEQVKGYRITITLPLLNNAAEVLVLVTGSTKAPIVARAVREASDDPRYPIQMVQPVRGVKRWMLDRAAAEQLGPVDESQQTSKRGRT